MTETDNFGSFIKGNTKLAKEYVDTRLEIFRLRLVQVFSKSAGYFLWMIISLFLIFLLMVFAGLVVGFWLSNLTGSYVAGFGYTTLIMLGVIILLALLRKTLFVNPIIRRLIHRMTSADEENNLTTGERI